MAEQATILIIDDDEIILDALQDILQFSGYRTLTASDGQSGVTLFAAEHKRVDLVILDLIMPIMGGKETLERLREIEPNVKVALSSGYDEDDVGQQLGPLAANRSQLEFLQKPYSFATITTLISHILSGETDRSPDDSHKN